MRKPDYRTATPSAAAAHARGSDRPERREREPRLLHLARGRADEVGLVWTACGQRVWRSETAPAYRVAAEGCQECCPPPPGLPSHAPLRGLPWDVYRAILGDDAPADGDDDEAAARLECVHGWTPERWSTADERRVLASVVIAAMLLGVARRGV